MKVNQNSAKSKRLQIPMIVTSNQDSCYFFPEKVSKPNCCLECKCYEKCENCSKVIIVGKESVSFSFFADESVEPTTKESFEDDIINKMLLEDLISTLTVIKPRYGRIFRLLYDGATQLEMADELNIKLSTVLDDIKKYVALSNRL